VTVERTQTVGFSCAYTPLPLLDAAGFLPHRILPLGEAPDQAGSLLHDNMCPHVKRILDRALAGDLPELKGVVFMESCDTMRRLADAWRRVRPGDRMAAVDLPSTAGESSVDYFVGQLQVLRQTLQDWSGFAVGDERLLASIRRYNELGAALSGLREQVISGPSPLGWPGLQAIYNRSVTQPVERTLSEIENASRKPAAARPAGGVPVLLIGNVLAEPAGFELLVSSGARIVGEELCTSGRQICSVPLPGNADPLTALARALLQRSPCARTLLGSCPGGFADRVLQSARAAGARGVIAHVMKFCDPYLGRLPDAREALRQADIPLLVLEGDCTLRSLGQHRTRIEAFIEMLE
jgi:benzoyl-CoA reductase/2-hydroxyglutaryl-CoA dehydratase subunit BcrC/BadD/HgdB